MLETATNKGRYRDDLPLVVTSRNARAQRIQHNLVPCFGVEFRLGMTELRPQGIDAGGVRLLEKKFMGMHLDGSITTSASTPHNSILPLPRPLLDKVSIGHTILGG